MGSKHLCRTATLLSTKRSSRGAYMPSPRDAAQALATRYTVLFRRQDLLYCGVRTTLLVPIEHDSGHEIRARILTTWGQAFLEAPPEILLIMRGEQHYLLILGDEVQFHEANAPAAAPPPVPTPAPSSGDDPGEPPYPRRRIPEYARRTTARGYAQDRRRCSFCNRVLELDTSIVYWNRVSHTEIILHTPVCENAWLSGG